MIDILSKKHYIIIILNDDNICSKIYNKIKKL